MVAVGLWAADEGVEGFEAVDQAVLHQEIEGAVDRRRRRAAAVALQLLEQLIGADRRMAAPDQLQHAAAALDDGGGSRMVESLPETLGQDQRPGPPTPVFWHEDPARPLAGQGREAGGAMCRRIPEEGLTAAASSRRSSARLRVVA